MGSSSSKKKGPASYPKQDMSNQGGYPQQEPQGYPPQQPTGYPPQDQMGYPPQEQMGYPPQEQMGYPPQEQMGYPQQQPMGYPPQDQMGYPPQQPMGYPPQQQYGQPPPGQRVIDDVDRHDSACQYQFKPGDETYRCMECEITEDCPIICRNCFDASEHRNHQYEMLRDEGGGWCDCGDHTAWREPFVYCGFHAPKIQGGQALPPPAGHMQSPNYGPPPPYNY